MATPGTAMNRRAEPADIENLPGLLTRLGDDVMQLFDTKISLLKLEVKEDVTAFLRGAIVIVSAGAVVLIGFALASVAIALGLSALLADTSLSPTARYGLGFAGVGLIYMIVGGIVALVAKGRLAKQNMVPDRTIQEFRKDKQWLKKEL